MKKLTTIALAALMTTGITSFSGTASAGEWTLVGSVNAPSRHIAMRACSKKARGAKKVGVERVRNSRRWECHGYYGR